MSPGMTPPKSPKPSVLRYFHVKKKAIGMKSIISVRRLSSCLSCRSSHVRKPRKSQRALSMAQQTRVGHVYVISNLGSFGENVYKIGMTRRLEPLDRVRELGDASVPFEFDVHAMIYSEDAPKLEKSLHSHFMRAQVNKVNPCKEFFRVGINEIMEHVESAGIQAHWTLTAKAASFRESQRIEQSLLGNMGKGSTGPNYRPIRSQRMDRNSKRSRRQLDRSLISKGALWLQK